MKKAAIDTLRKILGAPLAIPSELKNGNLVTIFPLTDHAALARFTNNWGKSVTKLAIENIKKETTP